MPRENNFLLGAGERLTSRVEIAEGGGPKRPAYPFEEARNRLAPKLARVKDAVLNLPEAACPNGVAVALVTLHPRYVSKSDHPSLLLSAVGLKVIGSRSLSVIPDQWGITKHPESALSEQLYVAGEKRAFANWSDTISQWGGGMTGADQLGSIEDVAPLLTPEKLRSIPTDREVAAFEIVLHNGGQSSIVDAFARYATDLQCDVLADRRRDVGGLTFLPIRAPVSLVGAVAQFSYVRIARGMPSLRPLRPTLLRSTPAPNLDLPSIAAVDGNLRVAVFDGGLPPEVDLSRWVRLIDPPGIGSPVPGFQDHGFAVTAALLFGPVTAGQPIDGPFCAIDHIRVLDDNPQVPDDLEYLDVLDRILAHWDANLGLYAFANISLGPNLAVSDDEVTSWTACLDERLAKTPALMTVAAGNEGESDSTSGLNRIQPPGDGVNVLTVGACNSVGIPWARAPYSCVGPGRCPGLVKPDGLAFGGTRSEPLLLPSPRIPGRIHEVEGTSFAAPLALRTAVATRVQLGDSIGPLAIRALLIHRADDGGHSLKDVGWGRFELDFERLITCDDDEALIVYQGELPVGTHLRAAIPLPTTALSGMVTLTAALVISPEVDPQAASTYTRSGLEVAFRPHGGRFGINRSDGTLSSQAKTRTFFSATNLYGGEEYELRDGAHKWEPCLRSSLRLRASSLESPCFDVYYHHRAGGGRAQDPKPIPYALVVSIKAPRNPDLYSGVVRAYANVLVPLKPVLRLRVTP